MGAWYPSVKTARTDLEPRGLGYALDEYPVLREVHSIGEEARVPGVGKRFGAHDRGVFAAAAGRARQQPVLRLVVQVAAELLREAVVLAVYQARLGPLPPAQ